MQVSEIKQAIIDANLTVTQLNGIDADNIRQRFPNETMSGTFIKKVLRGIQIHLDTIEDDLNSKEVEKAIVMFAKNNPNTGHKMYRENEKRYALVCLDGLDEEED